MPYQDGQTESERFQLIGETQQGNGLSKRVCLPLQRDSAKTRAVGNRCSLHIVLFSTIITMNSLPPTTFLPVDVGATVLDLRLESLKKGLLARVGVTEPFVPQGIVTRQLQTLLAVRHSCSHRDFPARHARCCFIRRSLFCHFSCHCSSAFGPFSRPSAPIPGPVFEGPRFGTPDPKGGP